MKIPHAFINSCDLHYYLYLWRIISSLSCYLVLYTLNTVRLQCKWFDGYSISNLNLLTRFGLVLFFPPSIYKQLCAPASYLYLWHSNSACIAPVSQETEGFFVCVCVCFFLHLFKEGTRSIKTKTNFEK